ncbi:MAG: hypothetical protein PHT86_01180 [Methanocorpusculum sp.]|nr:hypothetical protein [Methanocorpusculum sp.]
MTFGESKEHKNTLTGNTDTKTKSSGRKLKKESVGEIVNPTKAAGKTLSKLEKEKAAEETLIAYLQTKGAYLANQTAIESMTDEGISRDEKAAELPDDFLRGFHASEEYARALAAYKNIRNRENILCGSAQEEDISGYPAKSE